jgi:hypothetical protein
VYRAIEATGEGPDFPKGLEVMRAATKAICLVFVLTLGLALTAQVALAQANAGAKASGQYNFYGSSAHSSFHSARQNVDHYSQYLSSVQAPVAQPAAAPSAVADRPAAGVTLAGVVDREVAEEASDTIGSYIEKLGRYLGKMRKHAEAIKDTESLERIDDVERKLAEAKTHHEALDEHHSGEKIDAKTAQQHCEKINAALAKAQAEHDKLMKRLGDGDTK